METQKVLDKIKEIQKLVNIDLISVADLEKLALERELAIKEKLLAALNQIDEEYNARIKAIEEESIKKDYIVLRNLELLQRHEKPNVQRIIDQFKAKKEQEINLNG